MKDAFKQNDGQKVPLVWNHQHNDPFNVLGHAVLENRAEHGRNIRDVVDDNAEGDDDVDSSHKGD